MSALTIAEWLAILSLAGTLIFGIAKFYAVFTRLDSTLEKLEKAIAKLEQTQIDYGKEMAAIKEQIKTIFKMIGGK